MATVQPFDGTRYNPDHVKLGGVLAPPYDVISDAKRDELYGRDLRNIVRIDSGATFPDDVEGVDDRYTRAASFLASWHDLGVLVRDDQEGFYVVDHSFQHPDGSARNRRGLLATVEATPWESSDLRPHERTLRGPKADRLALLRATRAQTSPVFAVWTGSERIVDALEGVATGHALLGGRLDGEVASEKLLLWRVADPEQVAAIAAALHSAKLYVADGHHRYETARVYAEEIGGEGPHRYVLMCLVALEDPGLTVFPTHRLLKDLRPDQHEALANAIRRDFELKRLESTDELVPAYGQPVSMGYIDAHFRQPWMLTLKDQATADAALSDHAEPYRRLDTAVLEALILKGALGMTDDDIDHLTGLGYARDFDDALRLVQDGDYDAAFFVAATPIEQVRAVAAAGESMPPKSTYFFPKVPTGLLFNPLSE